MTPIINTSFNKHPLALELIHRHLLHPYDIFIKGICRHKSHKWPTKHCPKQNKHRTTYNILHRKMKKIPKGTTVDTSKLQPGELIHV